MSARESYRDYGVLLLTLIYREIYAYGGLTKVLDVARVVRADRTNNT